MDVLRHQPEPGSVPVPPGERAAFFEAFRAFLDTIGCDGQGLPWLGGEDAEPLDNATFALRPPQLLDCTCHHRGTEHAWNRAAGHPPACPATRPHFEIPGRDLRMYWIGWPHQDTELSRPVTLSEWRTMLAECLAAVPGRVQAADDA